MGFEITTVQETGPFILTLDPNFDVSKKLQCGDIILSANGVKTATTEEFKAVLAEIDIGKSITVAYCRGNETGTVDIVIGSSAEGTPMSGVTVIDVKEGEILAIDWASEEPTVVPVVFDNGLYKFKSQTE
jgi:PDZ domain-containing secreted protein